MIVRELITRLAYQTDNKGARDYEARLQNIARMAQAVVAVISGIGVAVALAGDTMTSSLAKIETAIGRSATSAAEARDVYERLYEVGQRTGVSANESADAFTRFNLAMRDLNRPASDTIDLIEGLQASAIVAGVGTQELTGSMIQLGQALASGKLQGDEFRTLRENMPAFLRDVAAALGTDMRKLMEDAEKGLLTPARLIPAMLQASARARRELADFPLTMNRSFSILRNTTIRFLADFDHAIGLSRVMAGWFAAMNARIERWRQGLDVVRQWVQRLGGLEQIFRAAAGALAVFTAAVIAYRAAAIGAAIAQALWLLPWIALGAAIVALGILLADFVAWVSGEDIDTLFGSWFGDFDTFIQPFMQAWTRLKDWLIATWQSISAEWTRFWNSDQIKETGRIIEAVGRGIASVWGGLANVFRLAGEAISTTAAEIMRVLQPILDAIGAVMRWMEDPLGRRRRAAEGGGEAGPDGGTGGSSAPRAPGDAIPPGQVPRGFGRRAPLYPPDLSSLGANPSEGLAERMPGAPQVNATQNNEITIQQVIEATGINPAEIAAAARSGVQQAGTAVGQSQDAFGRSIAAANPRTEAPAR